MIGLVVYSDKAGLILAGFALCRGFSEFGSNPYSGLFGIGVGVGLGWMCWRDLEPKRKPAEQPEVHP